MRTWEIEDNRATPSDLVREQDFMLQVRRLNRIGTPHQTVNLILTLTDPIQGGRGLLEKAHDRIADWAKDSGTRVNEMSNGDLFLTCEQSKCPVDWKDQIMSVTWPEGLPEEKRDQAVISYTLPEDYLRLRERINAYVEISRNAALYEGEGTPSRLLQTEAARGPITTWSTNQIEKLLNEIDIYKYIRTQPVCARKNNGNWGILFDECYIAVEALRTERFPKLENLEGSHLFLALCESLDQHLLSSLTDNTDRLLGRNLSINLSVSSVTGSDFSRFTRGISLENRSNIGFEFHINDFFQNLDTALESAKAIKKEGFKIALDNVCPALLPYLNLHLLDVDYIKINAAKNKVAQLHDPAVLKSMAFIPLEKIVFFRCDSEEALMAGLASGITRFQGWLIDGYIRDAQK